MTIDLVETSGEEESDFVEISFADSGAGIIPENTEKVFQPLFTTKARGDRTWAVDLQELH